MITFDTGGLIALERRKDRILRVLRAADQTATPIDALVMASAARASGVIYTSDPDDMMALQSHFRDVRIVSVQALPDSGLRRRCAPFMAVEARAPPGGRGVRALRGSGSGLGPVRSGPPTGRDWLEGRDAAQ